MCSLLKNRFCLESYYRRSFFLLCYIFWFFRGHPKYAFARRYCDAEPVLKIIEPMFMYFGINLEMSFFCLRDKIGISDSNELRGDIASSVRHNIPT